jgi:DNA polymerase I
MWKLEKFQQQRAELPLQSETTTRLCLATKEEFELWFRSVQICAIDTETTGLDFRKEKVLLISFSDGEVAYICTPDELDRQLIVEANEKGLVFIGHNIKFDLTMLMNYDIVLENVYDTQQIHIILFKGFDKPSGLASVCKQYFNLDLEKGEQTSFINMQLGEDNKYVFTDSQLIYAGMDTMVLPSIWEKQQIGLSRFRMHRLAEIENHYTVCLAKMEYYGVLIDVDRLNENTRLNKEKYDVVEAELYQLLKQVFHEYPELYSIQFTKTQQYANEEDLNKFSFKSPTQLKKILQHIAPQVTSVGKEELEKYLQSLHIDTANLTEEARTKIQTSNLLQLLLKLLEQKKLAKQISTYGNSFIALLDEHNIMRTDFKQNFPATGRISSGDKTYSSTNRNGGTTRHSLRFGTNLQNIPKTNLIRNCFIAPSGYLWGSCDLNSCEMRITADFSGDPLLHKVVTQGYDIHSLLSTQSYRIITGNPDFVVSSTENKHLRTKHKPCLFGCLYGAGPSRIATTLNIPLPIAKRVWQNIRDTLHVAFEWLDQYSTGAIRRGYAIANSRTNRRVSIPEMLNLSPQDRFTYQPGKSLKEALYNFPIQATNADMIKESGYEIDQYFKTVSANTAGLLPRQLFPVHDEINFLFPEDMPEVAQRVQQIMETVGSSYLKDIPMKSDLTIDRFWKK